MNNSINYGNFVDLMLSSDDDYEPYGLAEYSEMESLSETEPFQPALYDGATNQWRCE